MTPITDSAEALDSVFKHSPQNTDNALDSMGDMQTIVHEGQAVKFCCEPCVAKFKKNPAKYLAKLH